MEVKWQGQRSDTEAGLEMTTLNSTVQGCWWLLRMLACVGVGTEGTEACWGQEAICSICRGQEGARGQRYVGVLLRKEGVVEERESSREEAADRGEPKKTPRPSTVTKATGAREG
ncbi:hypothetical protein BOTCAL_0085g00100 [Botryotinia calthae]|uniref:Uncharacterized protein n=1 Tax=Botryotinia calthae TaxID=38488 RepID=A0A4Y8D7Z9_9HELO|nr:hypothetical protein BOTCAL_0085g00100 [Botryotinia calthae]